MAGSPYVVKYERGFSLPAPPQEVWSAVELFERFESWWGWLGELRVEGPGLKAGSVLHGVVAPPLPYRMRLRVVLADCDPPRVMRWGHDRVVDATVAGFRRHLRSRPGGVG